MIGQWEKLIYAIDAFPDGAPIWLRDLQHADQSEQEGFDEDGGKRRLLFLCH
jgi:hypothetical protein